MHRRNALALTLALGLAALLHTAVSPPNAWGQGRVFVGDFFAIRVYSRTANGDTAPTRTLSGPATGLGGVTGFFVDMVHNELVSANSVLDDDSITVHSRAASGNTAPIRTLSGPDTGLAAPGSPFVDASAATSWSSRTSTSNSITVYRRTASGNTAPIRTLSGASTPGSTVPAAWSWTW